MARISSMDMEIVCDCGESWYIPDVDGLEECPNCYTVYQISGGWSIAPVVPDPRITADPQETDDD